MCATPTARPKACSVIHRALIERPLIDFEPGLNMDRWLNLWKRARASEEGR
jgi:hypothetical protein